VLPIVLLLWGRVSDGAVKAIYPSGSEAGSNKFVVNPVGPADHPPPLSTRCVSLGTPHQRIRGCHRERMEPSFTAEHGRNNMRFHRNSLVSTAKNQAF